MLLPLAPQPPARSVLPPPPVQLVLLLPPLTPQPSVQFALPPPALLVRALPRLTPQLPAQFVLPPPALLVRALPLVVSIPTQFPSTLLHPLAPGSHRLSALRMSRPLQPRPRTFLHPIWSTRHPRPPVSQLPLYLVKLLLVPRLKHAPLVVPV